MKNKCFFILLFMIVSGLGYSQTPQTTNPFEMEYRMDVSELSAETTEEEQEVAVSSNPFDVIRMGSLPVKNIEKVKTKAKKAEVVLLDEESRKRFVFWLVLTMFLFLGVLVSMFRSVVVSAYRAFLNENYLKLLQRQNTKGSFSPYLALYGLYFFSLGTFIWGLINNQTANHFLSFKYLMLCIGGVFLLYLLKHMVLSFIGSVFSVSKEMKQYSFTIIVFSILLGLFLVPVNALLLNSTPAMASFVIYFAISVIFMVLLFRCLRALFLASKYISFHKFHFFMYICTVEIAPILILLKLVLLNTGLQ